MTKIFATVDQFIERVTTILLVLSVFFMLFFSVLNIFLRWGNLTLYWVEPLVRHLVFLSAFLGGVLATGRRNHIGIDVVGRWLESKGNEKLFNITQRIILIVCIGTICWLVVSAVSFMNTELEFGSEVFWGIHSGFLVGIIPVGFALIGYRFLNLFVQSFSKDKELTKSN